ncbi:hypothetical protein G7Y89_g13648 [Cudoniella acicularis]|uniref:Uncharacterized protein n=1 Tax=Cudoniella acicularis TaxID=354080 RepID=A0A8H4VYH2_9HELO|nr:hypothetical protein G7Y89_g13648 [Cudoniella acicularis]
MQLAPGQSEDGKAGRGEKDGGERRGEEVIGVVMLSMPVAQTGPFRGIVEKLLMLDTEVGSPAELVYPKLGYIEIGIVPAYEISPLDGSLKDGRLFYKDLRNLEKNVGVSDGTGEMVVVELGGLDDDGAKEVSEDEEMIGVKVMVDDIGSVELLAAVELLLVEVVKEIVDVASVELIGVNATVGVGDTAAAIFKNERERFAKDSVGAARVLHNLGLKLKIRIRILGRSP